MASFEYLVCSAQLQHLTFLNGRWQGEIPPNAAGALNSCPHLFDFLQEAGESGWELVAVTSTKDDSLTTLYLKREKTNG